MSLSTAHLRGGAFSLLAFAPVVRAAFVFAARTVRRRELPRRTLARSCSVAARHLERALQREVVDFEALSPSQRLALDAWGLLCMAAEDVDSPFSRPSPLTPEAGYQGQPASGAVDPSARSLRPRDVVTAGPGPAPTPLGRRPGPSHPEQNGRAR